jgi:hypothetical protein
MLFSTFQSGRASSANFDRTSAVMISSGASLSVTSGTPSKFRLCLRHRIEGTICAGHADLGGVYQIREWVALVADVPGVPAATVAYFSSRATISTCAA